MKWLYKVTNNVSGKLYIGVSIDPERRWNQHRTLNTRASALKDAIKKYGSMCFSFELICCGEDSYIDDLEVKAIQLYNTQVPNGYNITLGGDGACLISWNDDWNKLLGSDTDRAIAKQLGVTYHVVASRRKGMNIPSYAEVNQICWENIDPLLGTKPDYLVAKEFNISKSSVSKRRGDLSIPVYKDPSLTVSQEVVALLGTKSDPWLAREFNLPLYLIKNKRNELGVTSATNSSWVSPREWSDWEIAQIKDTSLTTKHLAKNLKLSRTTIQNKRKGLGVKYNRFNKREKYPLTDELKEELLDTSKTYKYFKQKYGMSSCTLSRKRKQLLNMRGKNNDKI